MSTIDTRAVLKALATRQPGRQLGGADRRKGR